MTESESPNSRVMQISKRLVIFIISLALILVFWYYYAINTNPIIFATPLSVGEALVYLFASAHLTGALLSMLWVLFLGFGLSVVTGIPIGLTMGRVRIVDQVLDPYLTAFYVLPRVAMVPLFIIWFGFGTLTSVLFVYTFSFFPIILTVSQGVKNTDRLYLDVAKVGCANERQVFTKVIIPSSVPYIFSGLRIGLALAYIGVIIAQLDMVVTGVGQLLLNAQEFYRTDEILAILVVLAIVGYLLSEFFRYLEGRMTHGLSYSKVGGI
ncbi:MAG: ABC transporter permease [Nitrososphaerota archaeon]|nr:ABC transporter permease [Nitrososphaerota archaeon]